MFRVVLDTNVYVSSLISSSGICNKIIKYWMDGNFIVFTNKKILLEIKKRFLGIIGS